MTQDCLIEGHNIQVDFSSRAGLFQPVTKTTVLSDISFNLHAGTTLGIVGESGSGKTTLARVILGLIEPVKGEIRMYNSILPHRDIQFIFQDPVEALDPRMRVEQLILEPLDYQIQRLDVQARQQRLQEVMQQVGLDYEQRHRYPHEFSGGQCQRIGIARAVISRPKILICDEPVSALDVSIRAQIIVLLKELQSSMNLTLIFIAHDLSLVRYISDRILVLYKGIIMESGPAEALFSRPQHPYTEDLIRAEPKPDPESEAQRLQTRPRAVAQSTDSRFEGCVYHPRCVHARDKCARQSPPSIQADQEQNVACFYPLGSL
jgi:oligopeptide transport system ATP-binding protein